MKRQTEHRLQRVYFSRSPASVAVDLLGCILHSCSGGNWTAGRIVETEAYLNEADAASHASWSRQGRAEMSKQPGTIYMYRAYGLHQMLNLVCNPAGVPGAVLVRGLEPIAGHDVMRKRRGRQATDELCSGPGKLCQAMCLDHRLAGCDIQTSRRVWIELGSAPDAIRVSRRVGISKEKEALLRFFDPSSASVSATRNGLDWQLM